MSGFGRQWKAFAAWYDQTEPSPSTRGKASAIVVQEPVIISALPAHRPPRIGLVCPRCRGEVVRSHPKDLAACLQCGFEPVQKRPQAYVFEPYEDASATSRASYRPEPDHRNGPVIVRVGFEPPALDTCVMCGQAPAVGEKLRANKCPPCYREHWARVRMRIA